MPKDKIALQGEDSFKAEMFKEFSDTIEDNALYVATTGSDSNAGTIDKLPLYSAQPDNLFH